MATREDINRRWSEARRGFTGTDEEFYKTAPAQGLERELNDYYSTVTDPGELEGHIADQQKRLADPVYGGASANYLATLRGQQRALTNKPPQGLPGPTTTQQPTAAPAPAPTLVEDRPSAMLPSLLDTNGPLMEKARADAMRTANARGLQNSSIAAGEGTKAALGVALPLALQEGAQQSQKNLASLGFGYNTNLQAQDIEGRKAIQGQADAAALQRFREQFASQEALEMARLAAEKWKTGAELTNAEKIAKGNWDNALKTTGLQIASNQTISAEAINANTTSANRAAYTTGVSNANTTYANTIATISNNTDIPAEARTQLIQDARTLRDSTIQMLNAVFNVTLTWPPPTAAGTAP